MRLLEVDEAANHIRELVDPDANIIWGSAFNPDLEGKIRVSVVATGIDADAQSRAAPVAAEQPRVFSFATPRRTAAAAAAAAAEAAPAPVAAPEPAAPTAPEPMPEPVAETRRVPEPYQPEPEPQPAPAPRFTAPPAAQEPDELLLGSENAVPERAPEPQPAPAPAPELGSRRRWLTGASDEVEAAPEPRPGRRAGGTLFERMASASRGAAKSDDEDKDPLDIPRFLRSQNNQ